MREGLAELLVLGMFIGGCTADVPGSGSDGDGRSPGPRGKADGHTHPGDAIEPFATCWIEPGTDDFFWPETLYCRFSNDAWSGGTANWIVSYPCGTTTDGFFVDDHEFGSEVRTARFVLADNSCPDDTDSPYPAELELQLYGTDLTGPRQELLWRASISSAEQATAEAPLRAAVPVQSWTLVIHTDLPEAGHARLTLDEYALPLGDLRARPRGAPDAEEVGHVDVPRDRRSDTFTAGAEERTVRWFAPSDAERLSGTLQTATGEDIPVEIPGPGRYRLDESGLHPHAPADGGSADAGPRPDGGTPDGGGDADAGSCGGGCGGDGALTPGTTGARCEPRPLRSECAQGDRRR